MGVGKSGVLFVTLCLSVVLLATLGNGPKTTQSPDELRRSGVRAARQERGYCHLLGWTEAESGAYYVFATGIFAPNIDEAQPDGSTVSLYFHTVELEPGASEELKSQLRSSRPIMEARLVDWIQSLPQATQLPGVEMDTPNGSVIQAAIPDLPNHLSIQIRATVSIDQDRFVNFQEVELNVGPVAG